MSSINEDTLVEDEEFALAEAEADSSSLPATGAGEAAVKDPSKTKAKKSGLIKFNDKIEIDPSAPVAKYNNGPVKAFQAIHVKGSTPLFAMICDRALIPRHHKASIYKSMVNQNLAPLVDAAPVYWPEAKQELFALIYGDVMGSRMVQPGKPAALGLKADVVLDKILPPLINIMQDFRDKDFVHGSIRPSNLFVNADFENIVLGDCLSTPSGYLQNAAYETIERGMADPLGRGQGTQASDLYSLGVTLAALLRHNDPLHGMSAEEIVKHKYEVGSYVAATGKDRFTGSILELLRGLLNDNELERWTLEEVLAWMDGRRLSPKQSMKRITSPRPLRFGGDKYYNTTLLAMDAEKHQAELRRSVEDGELKNWITRSLEQPKLYEHVETAVGQAKAHGQTNGYDERLACFISIAFDPGAPIRYKQLRMFPDGVGSVLASAYAGKGNVSVFGEMFAQSIVMNWIRGQLNPNLDIAGMVKKFDSCRNFVKQAKMGFGLERCLYMINPEANCMSDKLKDYFVTSPEDVLFAYEDLCDKGKAPNLFIDRHVAAFLGVKDNKVIENSMADINSDEFHKQMLGNLKCFATLQRRSQLPAFPRVAQAFAEQMNVIYKRYHDRKVREALKKNIVTYAAAGDLVKMSALLGNPEVQKKDFLAFRQAMAEYEDLRQEKFTLLQKMENPKTFGVKTGQEIAAVIACVISGLVLVTIGFMYLSKQGLL